MTTFAFQMKIFLSCLCPTLSDTFKDTNIGALSQASEVRPKSAISTRKRVYEHPRHFHVAKRPHRRDIRDFKIQRRGRQRERQKNNWLN